MPNIIEQQDLLKGLPDTRLAMLLQNPVGDIPPFLVAAEAQRRQAIRQQFAGSENKESVVDSLTKQLANVPQNIPAPTRTPPMVPPTPEMQGVAALQTQQAVQQMAQPQQMMRGGGMVQRYQGAGVVMPLQQRIQSIMEQFGVNEGDALKMIENNPSIAAPKIEGDLGKPFYVPETNTEPAASPLELNIPVFTTSPEQYEKRQRELMREKKYQEMDSYPGYAGNMAGFQRPDMSGMTTEEVMRDLEAQRRQIEMQNNQNTNDPTAQQQPGETPDEFRARYEELLAAQQPSDWERAQRYFAMAEQFLDPSKTTMQSIAGAGQAFAQSAAEQARAQREAELNLKKGLLEYDIAERNRIREAEAERENRRYTAEQELLKRRNPPAADVLDSIDAMIKDLNENIAKMKDPTSGATPEDITAAEELKRAYIIQRANILKSAGYGPVDGVLSMEDLYKAVGR